MAIKVKKAAKSTRRWLKAEWICEYCEGKNSGTAYPKSLNEDNEPIFLVSPNWTKCSYCQRETVTEEQAETMLETVKTVAFNEKMFDKEK